MLEKQLRFAQGFIGNEVQGLGPWRRLEQRPNLALLRWSMVPVPGMTVPCSTNPAKRVRAWAEACPAVGYDRYRGMTYIAGGRVLELPCAIPRRGMLALASAGLLAGCGFRPIYMPTALGKAGPAQRDLAAIRVSIIPDRPGQELRQALQERLNRSSASEAYRYNLAVVFSISGEGIGILPDTIATRIRLIGRATWNLTADDPVQTRIVSGTAHAMDGFDVLDQQYFAADLSNEQMQRRLANALADSIVMQLATFFRNRASIAAR